MKLCVFISLLVVGYVSARRIEMKNNCPYTIWPGWRGDNGTPNGGGTTLRPGASYAIDVPNDWTSGRIWARTGCNGRFDCETGFCGNSEKCNGNTGEGGATLAELGLSKYNGLDFYDVSHVDGHNLQIIITPKNGQGDCRSCGQCTGNILRECPNELKLIKNGKIVQCQSACTQFHQPHYCCTPPNNSPQKCPPTNYSRFFKQRSPSAYSYAFDDATSTFTCKNANYLVSFC